MGWVVSVTSRPRFTPGERNPRDHCTGSWVGPRAGLDTEVRGKTLCLYRGSNLDRPIVQSVAMHYTDWANPVPELLRMSTIFYCQTSCLHPPQKFKRPSFAMFLAMGLKSMSSSPSMAWPPYQISQKNIPFVSRVTGGGGGTQMR
jgi:hypothetical protein